MSEVSPPRKKTKTLPCAHALGLFQSDAGFSQLLTGWIRRGLEDERACLIVAARVPRNELEALLPGILPPRPSPAKEAAQRLVLVDPHEWRGSSPNQMIGKLSDIFHEQSNPKMRLRLFVDIEWISFPHSDLAGLFENEFQIFLHRLSASGCCAYSTSTMDPGAIQMALRTHPTLVFADTDQDNPFYSSASWRPGKDDSVDPIHHILEMYTRGASNLKADHTQYQAICENSLDAILFSAPDGRIFAANPAACRMFDRTEDELIRLGLAAVVDPENAILPGALTERPESGRFFGELTFLRSNRQRFPAELSSVVYQTRDGELRTSMVIRDISARKALEKELRESETRYRNLIIHSIAGISQSTPDGRLMYANRAYAEMYGYANPEEMLATVSDIGQQLYAHPEDREAVLQILEAQGVMDPREMEVLRRDGSRFHVLVSARKIKDADGKLICLQAEHVDISRHKQSEESLRESEARFATVFHASPLCIAITRSRTNTFIDMNETWLRTTGFSRQEALNQDPTKLGIWVNPLDRDHMVGILREKGIAQDFECDLRRKTGEVRKMMISAVPIDLKGEACLLTMAYDNTERKVAEEERETLLQQVTATHDQLRALAIRLQTAQEMERTTIAREIHDEFGQRLTAIKMDLAWLAEHISRSDAPAHAKLAGMVDLVQETIQNIRRMASDLRPGLLDDLGLVAAMDWYIQDWGSRQSIPVDVQLPREEVPFRREVSTALYRILQETLMNIARHAHASLVDIRFWTRKESAILRIRDDGRGIPADEILAPTSLGLLGMRERTRQIGGKILIEGDPGKGTTVTVEIPLNRSITAPESEEATR